MDTLYVILALIVFCAAGYLLYWQQKNHVSFTRRVLTALVIGAVLGFLIQLIFGTGSQIIKDTVTWTNLIGTGYVSLLKMVVTPLIFISVLAAIAGLKDVKFLGKYGVSILAVLLITTAISALIGIGTTLVFNLRADQIMTTDAITSRAESLTSSANATNASTIVSKILDVIPTNPFASLAGTGANATLATVVFAIFLGVACLGIKKKQPKEAQFFVDMVASLQAVIMRVVSAVMKLTPYGILALMFKFLATTGWSAIAELGKFAIASYVALALIFVVHLLILAFFKLNPAMFAKKSLTVLSFAFTSRSSATAIPLTIKTQEKRLGVPEGIASLAATFGASIGQNGCAGMYPAMVAMMIVPVVDPSLMNPLFIIELIIVITISSFGIAGVGGGATAAALVVLTAMKLPVELVAVLVAIEALIDMGRTLVNVSDGLLAGVVTAKIHKELDMDVYNSKDNAAELIE